MDMGGDDFIAKPFAFSVLTAKINAVLRRTYSFSGMGSLLEHKGLRLNLSDATAEFDGAGVSLTRNEFKILQLLMERAGNMVTRDAIMMQLWESESFIDDNTLSVNITRIRGKLEEIGISGLIETKRGMGYRI